MSGHRRFELVSISPNPTPEERRAVEAAVERVLEHERQATAGSVWLRAARAQGRRLGMFDYRDRFTAADAWRLSVRMPGGGREYPGLIGRADAR